LFIKETPTLLGNFCVISYMKRLWLILFVISYVWGQAYTCQYDGNKLTKTLQSKFEGGKTAYLWECYPIGKHSFWIVEQASSQYQSEGLTGATIDNLLMQWGNQLAQNNQTKEEERRHREFLEQQERIALAKMTEEQREEYYRLKGERVRKSLEEDGYLSGEISKEMAVPGNWDDYGSSSNYGECYTIAGLLLMYLFIEVFVE